MRLSGPRRDRSYEETMAAEGSSGVHEFPNLTRGLVARGYSDEDIAKVLGGNWLRLFKDVWAA